MDGTKNKNQIIDCLLEDAKNGKITLNKEGAKIEDENDIKKELAVFYDGIIEKLLNNALFI
jgi:methyltransferase-like protein